ncbi:MAG: 4-hydroxythreonine-4-phosphate dehydrogenase PdxA, partial [Phycisphaeraceae bacterium]
MSDATRPVLAFTMGDPAGVGPEITMKVLTADAGDRQYVPLLVADLVTLEEAGRLIGSPIELVRIADPADAPDEPNRVGVIEPPAMPAGPFPRGEIDARCGDAAFACIAFAIELAMQDKAAAVITNPIHKKSMNLAGHHYAGHTEIFRDLTGSSSSAMMLVADELKVIHVTTHIPLREASQRITPERIVEVTEMANATMKSLGIEKPRIGMCGLNPHASDGGLFGDEEETKILPAIARLRAKGIDVSDPLPGDTIFSLAKGGAFDCVVAQYHDQGHIPVKLLGFVYDAEQGAWTSVQGINVTLGLPILRSSVDHGTAF